MIFSVVNPWAVLVSAVVAFGIGMAWYSPVLFGNPWMKLMNLSEAMIMERKQKSMILPFAINFMTNLVMDTILAYFLFLGGAITITQGFFISFLLWLGLVVTVGIGGVIWDGKPVKLFLINMSYHLVTLLVSSIILTLWIVR